MMMMKKLTGVFAVLATVTILGSGCSKKEVKPDQTDASVAGANTSSDPSANVIEKPISTDSQGSDGGKIPGLSTVFFEYDQARLTNDARKKLGENAEWIKGHAGFTIQIEGHTDSRGSVEYNLALGERRAKSVKSYLESLGVESKRMTIISYGEEKPLENGDSESAWGKNRRANFVPLQ